MYTYQADASWLIVGNRKQTLFDETLLEMVQDVTRRWHQPVKIDANPVITKDRPWEHVLLNRTSSYRVLFDPRDRLFKCWYTDEGIDPKKYTTPENGFGLISLDVVLYRQLYAYSEDGVKWIKPDLGKYRFEGKDTNIIWGDPAWGSIYDCHVIDDPFERDERKRFKTLYVRMAKGDIYRIEAAFSADGINWTSYDELPSFGKVGPHLDDVLIATCDLESRLYILITRYPLMTRAGLNPRNPITSSFFPPYYPWDLARENRRRIFQCESSDFLHWGEPYLIMTPDEYDNLDETLYGMNRYRVGDTWVGFVNVLHQVDDIMEVQLAWSRDGRHWNRVHRPWLTASSGEAWDRVMVEMTNDPIVVGDEMYCYYGASGWGHHDWYSRGIAEGLDVPEARDVSKVSFNLGLAKLRMDGFCSLDAGQVREGVIVTRPLVSNGDLLVVNAECGPRGYLEAEIANDLDEPYSGFSRKECDVLRGDSVRHLFSWRGRTEFPAGQRRKIRFFMRDAHLYTFTLESSKSSDMRGVLVTSS
jgi:hypothetical protein